MRTAKRRSSLVTVALAVARRERHGGREAAGERVAPDDTDFGLGGLDRHAAVANRGGVRGDRDVAPAPPDEAVVLAKEAASVETQAARLRLVAEPELAEIEPPRLALAP